MTSENTSVKTVIVAKSDPADYQTIGEAVKNVEPETRILVQPGLYQESIAIDKPLEIWGDGRVYIESFDASCLVMQTEHALVRGLVLRNSNKDKQHKYAAVVISQGKLVLEDCNITSDSFSCVVISGHTTNSIIRRCRIHDAKDNGVYFGNKKSATIEDCDIYGNTYPGIYINRGSNPTIRQCRIYDNKQNGISIKDNGLGKVEDCDIYRNTYPGIYIDRGSNPIVSRCRIYDGKSYGIWITDNGLGKIEDCDIYSNAKVGIGIENSSNPIVSRCRIYDNKQSGIWIKDNGLGKIEDCDIYGNTYQGIHIKQASNPTIRQCRIYDGKSHGIRIVDNGLGTIEDCDIYRNAGVGVKILNKSNPTLRRCHIHHGKQEAILIQKQGQGSFQYCKIDRHPFPGIKIEQKCQPTFPRCTFETMTLPYLKFAIMVGFTIAPPIALSGGWIVTIASIVTVLQSEMIKRKKFTFFTIFGIIFGCLLGTFTSYSTWHILMLCFIGHSLGAFVLYPAVEQAKLMSNYDIKRQPKSKKISSSRL